MRQKYPFIDIRLKRLGDAQCALAPNNFHKRMMWDDKTGVKLCVDITRKSHLPNERFIDSCLTRNLPAKHLNRILTEDGPCVADGITAHIPNAPAAHRRVKQTNVFFAGKDKAKGTTDQFQSPDRTVLDKF